MIRLRTELNLIIEIHNKAVWDELNFFLGNWRHSGSYGEGDSIVSILNFKALMNVVHEHSTPDVQEIFRVADVDMIRNSYDNIIFERRSAE